MRFLGALVLALFVVWYLRFIFRRWGGIVAKRGMSVGADLATMNDKPRVHVISAATVGPDRVRVVLRPEDGDDLDLLVALRGDDFGYEVLVGWRDTASALALVIPEGGHLVRLRAIESLQPLTLRRVDA